MAVEIGLRSPVRDVEANLRRNVQALMALRGLTRADVQRQLGITKTALHSRLTGDRRFTVVEVADLAELLSVTTDVLLDSPELLLRSRWFTGTPRLRVVDAVDEQMEFGLDAAPHLAPVDENNHWQWRNHRPR